MIKAPFIPSYYLFLPAQFFTPTMSFGPAFLKLHKNLPSRKSMILPGMMNHRLESLKENDKFYELKELQEKRVMCNVRCYVNS